MTIPQLKKALQENQIDSLYLFVGEEKFLTNNYIENVKSKILTGVLDEMNLFSFNGEISFAELEDSIVQFPQMAEKKIIIAKSSGLIKTVSKEMQQLLANIPEYAVLIFVEDSLTKVSKPLLKIIEEKGRVIEFKKQDKRDICIWTTRLFAENNKKIDAKSTEYLVEICDKDMTRLKNEIEKLSFSTNEEVISMDLIKSLVSTNEEFKIYELADRLINKDAKTVYKMLKEFQISKEPATVIIASIFSQIHLAIMLMELKNEHYPRLDEFIPGNKKFLARKINTNTLDHNQLKKVANLCCDYDYKIKAGFIEEYPALEIIIGEMLL